VRTTGCQQSVISKYIDSKQLSCAELQARLGEEDHVLGFLTNNYRVVLFLM
jgi:hypothetical protein